MGRRIVITGGKGGVGKTSVTANLGMKLAKRHRVILMDTDIGLNNLDVALGVENRVVYDVLDCIEGRCRLRQALVEVPDHPNLSVMPSAHGPESCGAADRLDEIALQLSEMADFVLIDCPAGVESGFYHSVACAKEAIVVTTPHIACVRDAGKVLTLLGREYERVELLINRARGDLMLSGKMMTVDEIVSLLRVPLVGVIPDDDAVPVAAAEGTEVSSQSAGEAFSLAARNLEEGEHYVLDCTRRYRGLLGNLRRNFRLWA